MGEAREGRVSIYRPEEEGREPWMERREIILVLRWSHGKVEI